MPHSPTAEATKVRQRKQENRLDGLKVAPAEGRSSRHSRLQNEAPCIPRLGALTIASAGGYAQPISGRNESILLQFVNPMRCKHGYAIEDSS